MVDVGGCEYTVWVLSCGTYTTCGLAGSMTITCFPLSVVLRLTSCCAELFSFPVLRLSARRRCTLSSTPARSLEKAWPTSVVQSRFVAMKSTTCGNGTSATKLGSNFDCFAASCSAVPLNGGLVFSHLSRSVTRAGVVAHRSICASS